MKNLRTESFCNRYNVCNTWRVFAQNYSTMREFYQALLDGEVGEDNADLATWIFTRKGVTSEKNQRLFSVDCARRVQHLMKDECSIRALDVAERYANGKATEEEFRDAYYDAEKVHCSNDCGLNRAEYAAAVCALNCTDGSSYSAACLVSVCAVKAMEYSGAYTELEETRSSEIKAQFEILKTYGNIFEESEGEV